MSSEKTAFIVGDRPSSTRLAMAVTAAEAHGIKIVHVEHEDQIRGLEIDQVIVDELRGPPVPLPQRKQLKQNVRSPTAPRDSNRPDSMMFRLSRQERRAGRPRKRFPLFRP